MHGGMHGLGCTWTMIPEAQGGPGACGKVAWHAWGLGHVPWAPRPFLVKTA